MLVHVLSCYSIYKLHTGQQGGPDKGSCYKTPTRILLESFQVITNVKPRLRTAGLKREKAATTWTLTHKGQVKIGEICVYVGGVAEGVNLERGF